MQLLPRLRTLVLSAVLTMAMLGPRLGASTEDSVSHAAGATQNGATLTILAAPVEIARSGLDEFIAPSQGELLQVGDIVRTGPGGVGLITFFDGSESQLGPDSQLQIERLDAIPAIHIALLQTAGVTTNHVVPMRPGGSFQTDTPAAVAMVRGTSYVVAVTGLRMIRPSASSHQANAQVTLVASADGVAQSVDPTPASDPHAPTSDAAQADEAAGTDVAEAADMSNAPDVPAAADVEDAIDTAALEVDATLDAPHSPADQVAAAVRQSRALEPADPACRGSDEPQCLTSVVLLADADGRVGRVVVEPRASLAAVELTRPGDMGATSSRGVARGQLSASAVQQLQHRTQNLRDTQAAAATAAEVQLVVKAIELVAAPDAPQAVAPDAVQPVAPDAVQPVAPVAEAPASTPDPGPSPTPEVMAMLVVVGSVAVAPVTDEPTDAATLTPNTSPNTSATLEVGEPINTTATASPSAEAPVDALPAKPADTAATPAVAPASPGAVAFAAPIAVAPEPEKAPAVEVTPAAAPQTLATPGPVNAPAGAVATITPADTVPVKLADTAVAPASVAPATSGSLAPTASGAVPPTAPVTAAPGSEKVPSVGVTPTAAPVIAPLAATPAPSSVASPATAPLTTTIPTGSQQLAIATAAPATTAPNISPVPPIAAPVPPSPSPTPHVP